MIHKMKFVYILNVVYFQIQEYIGSRLFSNEGAWQACIDYDLEKILMSSSRNSMTGIGNELTSMTCSID